MAAAIGDSIQRYPLLRPLVFYLCGIGLADALYPHLPSMALYGAWGTIILLLLLLVTWALRREVSYGMAAWALFLVLGIWNYSQERSRTEYDWPQEQTLYELRVLSEPRARQRSVLCEMEVMARRDSSAWCRVGRKVMAYMEPCDEAAALMPGDVLCFKGRVRVPRNFSDSLSFDYARYVTLQGAAGTAYLPRRAWTKTGVEELSPREHMLRLRRHLIERYAVAGFEDEALGVISALTLGDKRMLSPEVRAVYSDAGAAHVLALSGMHVGIIYGMLAFVLRGLLRQRRWRWLRELLAVVVLWLFALMVGMAPSVVRAVSMCTLYIVARWVSDDSSSSLHVLSLTALLMLLARPLYLFDVGFQLSFMAMVAILWLEPYLENPFLRHEWHPIGGFFVGVLCMSLAAQLGTFPLVLHHFGTFPTYFLVTNLIVVPCLSLLLVTSLVWWALLLVDGYWAQSFGKLLQYVIEYINRALQCIGQWPGAVMHVEEFSGWAVLFSYLFILFAAFFVIKRWSRAAVLALASLLALLICFI